MPDVAAPLPEKPAGTQRNLGLMVLWMLLTFNIYWVVWMYKIYKEVRAHSPYATEVTPGNAVFFLFIPLVNIVWFIRVVVDFPRAIRLMQEDHRLGEAPLANGMVTTLLIIGMFFNLASGVHPAFLLLGEPLLIAGFLLAQRSLNEHWERHVAGVQPLTPGMSAARPLPTLAPGLGGFLGLRGPAMDWGPGIAFFVAWLVADIPAYLVVPLIEGQPLPPSWVWAHSLVTSVILAVAVVAVFRWISNDYLAAPLTAVAYALLASVVRFYLFQSGYDYPHAHVIATASAFAWPLLNLLALALALRLVRPAWLALWTGSLAGAFLSSLTFALIWTVVLRLSGEQGSSGFHFSASEVFTELVAATLFAFVFYGGSQLLRRSSS